jgi:DNA-binding PadR family transcriptional regulator
MFRHHRHHRRGPFFGAFGFADPRGRWSDSGWGDFPFGRWGGRRGGPFGGWGGFGGPFGGPGERFFGRGDLKYVILELLRDQPRHGYDIIRALEERMQGRYRPSPGSVYPTLQMLEDLGYVSSTQQEGKKVYTITDEGRRYLEEQKSTVDDIRERIASGWEAAQRPEVADLMHEVQQLARALFREGTRSIHDIDRLRQLREIVARTRAEVEALTYQRPSTTTTPTGAPPSEPRMV